MDESPTLTLPLSFFECPTSRHHADMMHTPAADLIGYNPFDLCCRVQKSQG